MDLLTVGLVREKQQQRAISTAIKCN